jgi:hypothetical protein
VEAGRLELVRPGQLQQHVPSEATDRGSGLGCWEIQAHRTRADQPDPADLVRVARVQALIATTTVAVSEAAARRGEIDAGVVDGLTLAARIPS